MKKVSFYFLFIMGLFTLLLICKDVKAYSVTGHEDFKKITFVNGEKYLLNEYSKTSIDKTMSSLKGYAFGWRTVYYNINEEAYYEGITIFSRSNKSNDIVKFDYILNETEITETSVMVKGSVSAKITGTIKKISMAFNGEGEYSKESGNSYTSSTKTSLNFNIQPNTRLSLVVTGKCYVTTGVSCYRFLGIAFKKGSFENVEVETIIYELREEEV